MFIMKNAFSIIKNKITQGYARADEDLYAVKSTNINVLLNRVRLDKKKESQKKLLVTAATSLGVALFAVIIF